MGLIRFILASSVVFAHTYGYVFVGSKLAVELFYIISGYLISFVIVESKTYSTLSSFYINRMLRIYPLYWMVSFLTLCFWLLYVYLLKMDSSFFYTLSNVSLFAKLSLLLSNFIIFGQDWLMFTGVNDGIFHFVIDFRQSDISIANGLILPQAWTLGLELTFYLLAPFILKNKNVLIFAFIISFSVKVFLYFIGLGEQDPWSYRFFPAELCLFLLGSLSHQFLSPILYNVRKSKFLVKAVTLFLAILIMTYFLFNYYFFYDFILIFVFSISLPMVFEFNKKYKWDRFIGDLSYPIYIGHILILLCYIPLSGRYLDMPADTLAGATTVLLLTTGFAIVTNLVLNGSINNIRAKVRNNKK